MTMLRPLVFLTAIVFATPGCGRGSHGQRYETETGVVTQRQTNTGEITVSSDRPRNAERPSISCIITRDSEIYVDDRLSSIEDVRIGDRIAMVGYREQEPGLEHFIISYGRIQRSSPSSVPPEFIRAALSAQDSKRDE